LALAHAESRFVVPRIAARAELDDMSTRSATVRAAMDRTLVICKPDAVERGLVGEIIRRFEARSLRLVAAELRTIDRDTASRHYAEHEGKPFYADLVDFITRGPAMLVVVEGPEDTYKVVRTMMGVTNPREAAPGTIRGDLGIEFTENLIHGSDSPESAAREIGIFFPDLA
jgi:nucleoside-diphosphate kinase